MTRQVLGENDLRTDANRKVSDMTLLGGGGRD